MAFSIVCMVKMKSFNFARTLFQRKPPLNVLKIVFLEQLTLPSWQFLVMVFMNAVMELMKNVRKTSGFWSFL